MDDITDPRQIDGRLLRVLCRQPAIIMSFPSDQIEDFEHPRVRALFHGANRLRADGVPVTLETLAELNVFSLGELEQYHAECPYRALHEWTRLLPLLGSSGTKRRMRQELTRMLELLDSAPLTAVPDLYDEHQSVMRTLQRAGIDLGPTNVGDILDAYLEKVSTRQEDAFRKIPTGIRMVDDLTRGGMWQNWLVGLFGKYKNGKTFMLRRILLHMARNGYRVMHIAHDGGNREVHMFYYWAMIAQELIWQQPDLEWTMMEQEAGGYTARSIITFDRMVAFAGAIARNRPVPFECDKRIIDCVMEARKQLDSLAAGKGNGHLRIIDAPVIRKSPERVVRVLGDELVHHGLDVWALDHVGEMGERQEAVHVRLEQITDAARDFCNQNPIVGICLSQLNLRGGEEKSVDRARGGDYLLEKCDLAMMSSKQNEDRDDSPIELFIERSRWSRGGKNVKSTFRAELDSGMLIEEGV